MGLITRLVDTKVLEETVNKLALEMADLAPLSQSNHKKILQKVVENQSLRGFDTQELDLPFVNFDSDDFQEGRKAFVERRAPNFSGK